MKEFKSMTLVMNLFEEERAPNEKEIPHPHTISDNICIAACHSAWICYC
jgi:hypothetical protein